MTLKTQGNSGFTLAETLVALFILALITAAGAGLLTLSGSAGREVRTREAELTVLELAEARLRDDIASLTQRLVLTPESGSAPRNLAGASREGDGPILTLVRNGWSNLGGTLERGEVQLVHYRLDRGRLIREWPLHPDEDLSGTRQSLVLLENVSRVELAFIAGEQRFDRWDETVALLARRPPGLLRIGIIFTDGRRLDIAALSGLRP
jgi:general secretion pathway protein J